MTVLKKIVKRFKAFKNEKREKSYSELRKSFISAKNNYIDEPTNENRLTYLNVSNALRDLDNKMMSFRNDSNHRGFLIKSNNKKVRL